MKAIRPSDETRLRMLTNTGGIEVHVYEAKHRSGASALVGIPHIRKNLAVLVLPKSLKLRRTSQSRSHYATA